MKSMKLYSDVHRIYNNLAALGLGPDAALTVDQLTPFDQYHYDGTAAVDLGIARLGLQPGQRLLDIGSGIGGPARHVAHRFGLHVTALELQPDLNEVARDLTQRCGLAGSVTHVCGDILAGDGGTGHDGIISLLCMLHIPDKPRLFAACRRALKPGGAMYVEDFALARPLTPSETESLAVKVQSRDLPTPAAYRQHLQDAGFATVHMVDVTADWQGVSVRRLADWKAGQAQQEALHGPATYASLLDFYQAMDDLWQGGGLTGLRILAR